MSRKLRPQTSDLRCPQNSVPPKLENSDLENLELPPPDPPKCTLGARGFSCAVSSFGQVSKSDPHEKLPVARKQMTHIFFLFLDLDMVLMSLPAFEKVSKLE